MKAHERREAMAYPYFKVDAWDDRIGAFRPARGTYATQAEARAACRRPGRYRVGRIGIDGVEGREEFTTPPIAARA